MNDHKNTILAIALSAIVMIAWQFFFGLPQLDKQKQVAQQQAQERSQPQPTGAPTNVPPPASHATPGQPSTAPTAPSSVPGAPTMPAQAQTATRASVIAASPRVSIETPTLQGSIALKGGRIDDLSLLKFTETVDPKSPPIILLSPSGSPDPFYAEFGWVGAPGSSVKVPGTDTMWTQDGSGALSIGKPVKLTYDNGAGLIFHRTISVDDQYLFTVRDDVQNTGTTAATLFPYGLVSRHGMPQTLGYYLLHEGMIGVLGDSGLQEITYKKMEDKKDLSFDVTNGWLGITDKYWAAALLPDTSAHLKAHLSAGTFNDKPTFQADYLGDAKTVAPGATTSVESRLFAGAKQVSLINAYNKDLKLNRFDLLIDWGWFYFITKPMFWTIDFLFHLLGNFGLAILAVTVLVKAIFFPLANKSYASMAKMKAVQPELTAIRERYKDDKVKQQQAMMELYKKQSINPVAGCLPIVIQIPVFFALYKMLYVTIEMRHAPFFGWIRDLSAPDPTNVFNLFGLISYDPTQVPFIGHFLVLGAWPMLMGVTMWCQMKLNPTPPDPTQKMIFDWMPLIFTFMLSTFPAGLVIYWAWNNTLSVIQQSIIMRRHGAKVELWDNLKSLFVRKKAADKA
jgi:YidC/Oxa1 family membrane protein insertase